MSKNTDKESVSNMSQQDYHIRPGMSVAEIDSNCEIVA